MYCSGVTKVFDLYFSLPLFDYSSIPRFFHRTLIYYHNHTLFLIIMTPPPTRGKRGPELDCLTRARICELHTTNGWGATTINKRRFPDIPRSTIQYTLTQESKRQKQESLPRSGTSRKLTDEDRDHIYELIQNNPTISAEDLRKEVDFKVCRGSIWRLTQELGLQKWRNKQRPASTSTPKPKKVAKVKHICNSTVSN